MFSLASFSQAANVAEAISRSGLEEVELTIAAFASRQLRLMDVEETD